MHKLWLERCRIVHKKIVDGTDIEEKIDLRMEIRSIITNHYHITLPFRINEALTATLKSWLFQHYLSTNNLQAYERINERTL